VGLARALPWDEGGAVENERVPELGRDRGGILGAGGELVEEGEKPEAGSIPL